MVCCEQGYTTGFRIMLEPRDNCKRDVHASFLSVKGKAAFSASVLFVQNPHLSALSFNYYRTSLFVTHASTCTITILK